MPASGLDRTKVSTVSNSNHTGIATPGEPDSELGVASLKADAVSFHYGATKRTSTTRRPRDLLHRRAEHGHVLTTQILDSVSVHVARGEFLALVGPSGCGKTTLLNLFAGLITPSSGTVTVNERVPKVGDSASAYMFARDALLPWRTCRRNVELALEGQPKTTREQMRQRSVELLEYVGLSDAAALYPRQLSQGMRQRVALARVMAPNPDILLMDEPFAALDAQTKLRLQNEFLRIWEEGGASRATVLFVTHDLQEALLLADRVIVMHPKPGRIAYDHQIELPRPRNGMLDDVMFEASFRTMHRQLFGELSKGLP